MTHSDLPKGARYGIRFATGGLHMCASGRRRITFSKFLGAELYIAEKRREHGASPLSSTSRVWDDAKVVTIVNGEVVS